MERFYKRHQLQGRAGAAIVGKTVGMCSNFSMEIISEDGLEQLMDRLGFLILEEHISRMANSVDADEDGGVDFNKLTSLYRTFSNEDAKGKAEEQEEDKEVEDDLNDAFPDAMDNLRIRDSESIT